VTKPSQRQVPRPTTRGSLAQSSTNAEAQPADRVCAPYAVCSITLGSQAVSPLEMTVAFATFAARGLRHDPQAIALVRAPDGRVLGRLERKGGAPSHRRSPTK
jgi:membrane peptidoglycan carboxypeptidase